MQLKPEKHLYEYAVIRFVPRVEREEFINVGLIMMCKRKRWIRVRIDDRLERMDCLASEIDRKTLLSQLQSFSKIAAGNTTPIGMLEAHERFRWLTAVRSASVQTSRPHPGKCMELDATFDRLYSELVE